MPRTPHVLILSTTLDTSTDEVVAALSRLGVTTTRLDSERFPFDAGMTMILGETSTIDATYAGLGLHGVTSTWYRRVRSPMRPDGMTPGIYDFCLRESRSALIGGVLAISNRIMSRPENIWAAEHKVFQLSTAQAVGLQTPETVVTNEPARIREAFEHFGRSMIAKPVRTGFVDHGDEQCAIYTSEVLESHLDNLGGAHLSPTIFQRLLPKRSDVRVTFVDREIFVAEIDSQSDPAAVIDWRQTSNPHLPHSRARLPKEVETRARLLMNRLGLVFGAMDFVRTAKDEWIFLEVNPNGQWLWLDDMLEFGITDAMARWLAHVEDG